MSGSPPFNSAAIVGLGLLGGSLAEAARRKWSGLRIIGVSSAGTLAKAREAGLVDAGFVYADVDEACADADLVVLCTPIDRILRQLSDWKLKPPRLRSDCVLTDVGSTKARICRLGREAFPFRGRGRARAQPGPGFIGSHPMAGSEKTGMEARDSHLFENAAWVLCPEPGTPGQALGRLQDFLQSLGARTTCMHPEVHDRVAAHVSHLPQLVSTALAGFAGRREDVLEHGLQMAGGGFRDMTRIAASSFSIWEPILRTNLKEVRRALRAYLAHVRDLEKALAGLAAPEGTQAMAGMFREGNAVRARLSTQKKGFSTPLTELLVDIPDQPGMLVKVLGPLAEKGLNVLDLEILKVREGEEGVLMMAFKRSDQADAALAILKAQGLRARLR